MVVEIKTLQKIIRDFSRHENIQDILLSLLKKRNISRFELSELIEFTKRCKYPTYWTTSWEELEIELTYQLCLNILTSYNLFIEK
jgi:hypothetical protein